MHDEPLPANIHEGDLPVLHIKLHDINNFEYFNKKFS